MFPLIAGDDMHTPSPSGTGVFIAPRIALTAKHVVEDYWRTYDDPATWGKSGRAGFSIQGLQYDAGLARTLAWQVSTAYHVSELDIAVLSMVPPADLPVGYRPPVPKLRLEPPNVGDEIEAFGYPRANVIRDDATAGWLLGTARLVATGMVTRVFPERRDLVKLPFPSLEMNLRIEGGMSGGPVFDRAGRLCALVCSSFELQEGGEDVSYASLLWPAMALPATPAGEPRRLLIEFARDGTINVEDHHLAPFPSDGEQIGSDDKKGG